jgi:hypothetical protein
VAGARGQKAKYKRKEAHGKNNFLMSLPIGRITIWLSGCLLLPSKQLPEPFGSQLGNFFHFIQSLPEGIERPRGDMA